MLCISLYARVDFPNSVLTAIENVFHCLVKIAGVGQGTGCVVGDVVVVVEIILTVLLSILSMLLLGLKECCWALPPSRFVHRSRQALFFEPLVLPPEAIGTN